MLVNAIEMTQEECDELFDRYDIGNCASVTGQYYQINELAEILSKNFNVVLGSKCHFRTNATRADALEAIANSTKNILFWSGIEMTEPGQWTEDLVDSQIAREWFANHPSA